MVHAPGQLRRALEPQHLLDGVGVEGRIDAQPIELLREAEEMGEPVADQVARGLVAGDVQQEHLGQDLVIVEHVAGLLRVDAGR